MESITENPGGLEIDDPGETERVTTFNYEPFATNLKSIDYPGGLSQNYTYNGYGQLTSEFTNIGETRFGRTQTYDYHPESNPGGGNDIPESPRIRDNSTGGYLKRSSSSFGDILDKETWNNWDTYIHDSRGNLNKMNSSDGTNAIYEVTEYDEVWREKITSSFTGSLSPISYEGNYTYYDNGNLWNSSTQYGCRSPIIHPGKNWMRF